MLQVISPLIGSTLKIPFAGGVKIVTVVGSILPDGSLGSFGSGFKRVKPDYLPIKLWDWRNPSVPAWFL